MSRSAASENFSPPLRGSMRNMPAALIWALLLGLAGGKAAAQEIHISYPGLTGESAPLWVAREAGFFKESGIDARQVYMDGVRLYIQSPPAGTSHVMAG